MVGVDARMADGDGAVIPVPEALGVGGAGVVVTEGIPGPGPGPPIPVAIFCGDASMRPLGSPLSSCLDGPPGVFALIAGDGGGIIPIGLPCIIRLGGWPPCPSAAGDGAPTGIICCGKFGGLWMVCICCRYWNTTMVNTPHSPRIQNQTDLMKVWIHHWLSRLHHGRVHRMLHGAHLRCRQAVTKHIHRRHRRPVERHSRHRARPSHHPVRRHRRLHRLARLTGWRIHRRHWGLSVFACWRSTHALICRRGGVVARTGQLLSL